MKNNILLTIIYLLGSIFSYSQEVRTYADTNMVVIGDQFLFTIEVNTKKNDQVILHFPKDSLNKFDIINTRIDTILNNDSITYLQKIKLGAFEEGSLYIDPMEIKINDTIFMTTKIPVVVLGIEVDTASNQIFDIKDIVEVPYTFLEIVTFIAYIFLIFAILYLVVYYVFLRKKEKRIFIPKEEKEKHPYILAKEKLDILKNKDFLTKGMLKEFYTELTDIIRLYLEQGFKIDAMESTTREIIHEIKKNVAIDKKLLENFKKLLENSDLVKFAKLKPSLHECESDIDFTGDFLKILNSELEKDKNGE